MSPASRTWAAICAVTLIISPLHAHPLSERGSLLSSMGISEWSQPADHPAAKLFRRAVGGPAVGSAEWLAQFPETIPDATAVPQAWKDALAKALAAGLIPDIPHSVDGVYPAGTKPAEAEICASAFECRGEGDIWDSPDGMLGVSFDDGPTPASPQLYDFLKANNQKSTNFYIGNNIRSHVDIFMQAYNDGNDIACHTYSHRWMTSLTNEELVAEFGWTLQIASDLTGGRLIKYWRPPFGDSDNRVRAIAKNIFGLVQVNWNQDTDDWELGNGKTTPEIIASKLKQFIALPKSPGLMILEHELYPGTVQAFIDAYPLMKAAGWDTRSIPQLFNTDFYQNAADNTAAVVAKNVAGGGVTPNVTVSSTGASSVTASSTASAKNLAATLSSASSTATTAAKQSFALPAFAGPSTLVVFVLPMIAMLL